MVDSSEHGFLFIVFNLLRVDLQEVLDRYEGQL